MSNRTTNKNIETGGGSRSHQLILIEAIASLEIIILLIKLSVVLSKSNTSPNYNTNTSIDSISNTNSNKNLEFQEAITRNYQDIITTRSGFLTTPDANDNEVR